MSLLSLSDFKIQYQNTIESNLDPKIKENEIKLKSKALMDIFNVPGLITKYTDKSNFNYKPEYLNLQTWLKPSFTYSAEYFWQRNLQNTQRKNIFWHIFKTRIVRFIRTTTT